MNAILRSVIGLISLGFLVVAAVGCSGPSSSAGACDGVVCLGGLECNEETGECEEPEPEPPVEECGDADNECAEGTLCNQETGFCEVAADEICESTSPWAAGEPAFRDASSDWKLDESGANGQRLSVADIDGDGLPDLSVRRAGSYNDDFSEDGERASWLLRNTGGGGFEDVTRASGLVATRSGSDSDIGRPIDLIIWADVDNDGDLDAYTAYNKQQGGSTDGDSAEIMINEGDGTFSFGDVGNAARNAGEVDSPGGASFVDVDRDGDVDLWISQYAGGRAPMQDQLLLGDGSGGFEEVTDEVGLSTAAWQAIDTLNQAEGHSLSWGAAACDLNGDGTSELLAASYGRAPNHLWLAERADDGAVSFTNRSIDSGYAFDHRIDWTDNESARCWCKHHPDDEGCDGVPEPELIRCDDDQGLRWNHDQDREPFRLGGNSGTTVCADIDNDGWLDLLTTEIVHWDVGSSSDPSELLYNQQDDAVRFERPGNDQTGLVRERGQTYDDGDITGAIFDFDNDGRKDVYVGSTDYAGTRGHLWHQKADGTFEKVSLDDGIDHTSSHGVAVADYDRDGDLDLVVGHSRFRCETGDHCYSPENAHVRLFENITGQDQNWLQFTLEGADGTNRAAIGARVTVETDDLTQVSEVGGGHGHYGIQHDLTQHFGLGDACRATVTVRWPDESLSEQTFVIRAGHRYIWRQGEVPAVVD